MMKPTEKEGIGTALESILLFLSNSIYLYLHIDIYLSVFMCISIDLLFIRLWWRSARPNESGAPTLYHRFGCTRYCHYQYCMVNGKTRKANPILLFFRLWWCSAPPSGSGAYHYPHPGLTPASG